MNTIALAELVNVMRGQVVVRNEGVAPEDRYAPDNPTWVPPTGPLPDGLAEDEPLHFEVAISDEAEFEDDEDDEDG